VYKILVSDGLQENAINELIKLGFSVTDEHYDKVILGEKL
jgi:D-3-phosphoglycerate dehydrogenase / 2-oxoglutarate reductase